MPLSVRAAATLELRRRKQADPHQGAHGSFSNWIARARPEYRWDAPHFRLIHGRLDDLTAGRITRLALFIAGRHGKTESITSYAAYRLERDPTTRILAGTHSQQQAHKLSRGIRRLARARGVALSSESDSASEWETTAGGGVRAVGNGTGIASVNADLIIIDDPVGTRDEAESRAHRDRVWDWMTSDVLARAEPKTGVIVSMPRWHSDDPAGRLLDQQGSRWSALVLPGRAESPNDPLGRALGEPLWPEERGEEWLDQMRAEIGEYAFASFIQCAPRPREGGMFKWSWWGLMDAVPLAGPMVRYWDLAGTESKGRGHDPDYTAGSLLSRMNDQRTAIVDMARFRESLARRDAELLRIAAQDRQMYGSRVVWWIEKEAGIAGTDRTALLLRQIQALGVAAYTEPATGKKEIRAEPLASAAEAGNVLLCPGSWRDEFRAEAADFPFGAHDDMVDSAAGAFNKLGGPRAGVWGSSQHNL